MFYLDLFSRNAFASDSSSGFYGFHFYRLSEKLAKCVAFFNEVHPFLHVLRFFHVREIVTLKGLGLHQEQIQEYKKEVANIWQRKMLLK